MNELIGKLREKVEEIRPCLCDIESGSDEGVYDNVLCDSCDSISSLTKRMLEMLDALGDDGEITPAIADDLRECAGLICDNVEYMRHDARNNIADEDATREYYGYDEDYVFVPWGYLGCLESIGEEIREMLEPLRVPDDFTNERIAECWEACKADLLAKGRSRVEDLPTPDRANPDKLDYVIRFSIGSRWQRDALDILEDAIEDFFSEWFGHRCNTFMMPTYLLREGYTAGFSYR